MEFLFDKELSKLQIDTSGSGPEKAQVNDSSLLLLAIIELRKQAEGDFS